MATIRKDTRWRWYASRVRAMSARPLDSFADHAPAPAPDARPAGALDGLGSLEDFGFSDVPAAAPPGHAAPEPRAPAMPPAPGV